MITLTEPPLTIPPLIAPPPPVPSILTEDLSSTFVYTDEQESCLDTLVKWVNSPSSPREYRLGGYAGTGKTTILRELRSRISRTHYSVVSAFTGKAVNVLMRKQVTAQTLHSLMYNPVEDRLGNITFEKKSRLQDSPSLIIVDEASMLSTDLYNDLKSYGTKLLFVGDPGQLEPVGDNPNLMAHCDLTLQKIHRQAEHSPIIQFATHIRTGGTPKYFQWKGPPQDALLIRDKAIPASVFLSATQSICAKNKTRQGLNLRIRLHEGRPERGILTLGEKLICLRNNRTLGVFNGMIFFVRELHSEGATYYECTVEDEGGNLFRRLKIWKEPFIMPLVQDIVPHLHAYCDYGYVITCHKAQGSEWDHVLVIDEWMPPSVWEMKRWRYTAITRAAKKLTFCL